MRDNDHVPTAVVAVQCSESGRCTTPRHDVWLSRFVEGYIDDQSEEDGRSGGGGYTLSLYFMLVTMVSTP